MFSFDPYATGYTILCKRLSVLYALMIEHAGRSGTMPPGKRETGTHVERSFPPRIHVFDRHQRLVETERNSLWRRDHNLFVVLHHQPDR